MFKSKTIATILSTFTTAIAELQKVETEQRVIANKKIAEMDAARLEGTAAIAEANRAAAIAAKFQKLVDAESI